MQPTTNMAGRYPSQDPQRDSRGQPSAQFLQPGIMQRGARTVSMTTYGQETEDGRPPTGDYGYYELPQRPTSAFRTPLHVQPPLPGYQPPLPGYQPQWRSPSAEHPALDSARMGQKDDEHSMSGSSQDWEERAAAPKRGLTKKVKLVRGHFIVNLPVPLAVRNSTHLLTAV
jgi:hypothetical protein